MLKGLRMDREEGSEFRYFCFRTEEGCCHLSSAVAS